MQQGTEADRQGPPRLTSRPAQVCGSGEAGARRRRLSSRLTSVEWVYIKTRYLFMGATILGALAVVIASSLMGGRWLERSRAWAAIHAARHDLMELSPYATDGEVARLLAEAEAPLRTAERMFADGHYGEAAHEAARSHQIVERAQVVAHRLSGSLHPARFLRIDGEVTVRRAVELTWSRATVSDVLHAGDWVRTASSSVAELIYDDGRVSTISPGSLVEVMRVATNAKQQSMHVAEFIKEGAVRIRQATNASDQSTHELHTGTTVVSAFVREADVLVAMPTEEGPTQVDLLDGRARIAAHGREVDITPGSRVRVHKDGTIADPIRILPSPELFGPQEGWVFRVADPANAVIPLVWRETRGARAYRLIASRSALLARPEVRLEWEVESTARLSGLEPGWWFWQVVGIDAAGEVGRPSVVGSFRVETARRRGATDAPPHLEIHRVMQAGNVVIVIGETEPGVDVLVGDGPPTVAEQDGRFTAVVQFAGSGTRAVTVRAVDHMGLESVLEREVYLVE